MNAITHSTGWGRVWGRIKALFISEAPQTFYAGADHGRDWSTPPQFPAIAAEVAASKYPYVYSCVSIVSSDVAGVPLKVSRLRAGVTEDLPEHPFLELIKKPNSAEDGNYFLRQLWWDYLPNGWAVALKLRDGQGDVVSLIRLHPSRVQVRTDDFGFLSSIEYATGGPPVNYGRDDVLFFRKPGWMPGPAGQYGIGWVQPLQDDLKGETRVVEFNAKAFGSGTPAMFATLKDPAAPPAIGQSREDLEKKINDNLRRSHGGVHLLNGAYELTQAERVPKDMEGLQQRDWNRRSTLAVSHVPPIKVGLETANYATSVQQDRGYWEYYVSADGKGGEGAVFLGEFTRLAQEMSGDPSDVVTFDVSGISALQESRSDRLTRVGQHILYGMTPIDAYAFEGFEDAPIEDEPAAAPAPVVVEEEAQPGARSIRGMLAKAVTPRSTTARDIAWKTFAAELADPFEMRLQFRMARALAAAKRRYIARIREATGTKALSPSLLDAILGTPEEFAAYLEALTPTVEAAHSASYSATARRMRVRLDVDREARAEAVQTAARRIMVTTADEVKLILSDDKPIADLIQEIRSSSAFSIERAKVIARTETMRALNEGATDAMVQAEIEGVELEGKMWLSARDGSPPVRKTHEQLDGKIVGIHDYFQSSSGAKALHPGSFGVAEEDIQCFVAGTEVRGSFVAGVRSLYEGPVVELRTKQGRRLQVTAGHPILTPNGWVRADTLHRGSHVLGYVGDIEGPPRDHEDYGPAMVEQVHGAIRETGALLRVGVRPQDLHGEGSRVHGDVDVVAVDRELLRDLEAMRHKSGGKLALMGPDVADSALSGAGPLDHLRSSELAPARGDVSGVGLGGATLGGHGGPLHGLRFGATADLDAALSEASLNDVAANAGRIAQLFEGAGLVFADEVVHVDVQTLRVHVYDLQSTTGLLVAQGIVTSNCRCVTVPVVA